MLSDHDGFNPQNPQPAPPAVQQGANGGSRPVPDPTILTTEAMNRQNSNLKELLVGKIDGVVDLLEARFEGITQRFATAEEWRKEQKTDTKTGVDTAMSAAEKGRQEQTTSLEKSIAKSEAAAAEQIRQMSVTFQESTKSVRQSLDDLKERVLRMESTKAGATELRHDQRLDTGTLISLAALGAVIVSLFLTR